MGVLLAVVSLLCLVPGAAAQERLVEVDGRGVNVRMAGLQHLGKAPVVVLENGGGGGPMALWDAVQRDVARFAPVIAYDRAGYGKSQPDGMAPEPRAVAQKLRRVLAAAKLPPPYVLVGLSWGGPLIRVYSALYPTEVAGMVYLDPADLRTRTDDLAYLQATGYTAAGAAATFQQYHDDFTAYVRTMSGAARAEMELEFRERWLLASYSTPHPGSRAFIFRDIRRVLEAAQGDVAALRRHDWTVFLRRAGPIVIGISLGQVRQAIGDPRASTDARFGDPPDECSYLRSTAVPSGLDVMFSGRTAVRVDVTDARIRLKSGPGVGSTEAEVSAAYPGQITTGPHKYEPQGHYLLFTPRDARERRSLGIVFETDGRRVTQYRIGTPEAIALVERCG